jgi:hypothetical protein
LDSPLARMNMLGLVPSRLSEEIPGRCRPNQPSSVLVLTAMTIETRLPVRGSSRRQRGEERREHRVTIRLTPSEMAALTDAARREGLALAAFVAQAATDRAEYRAAPVGAVQRATIAELIRISGLLCSAEALLNRAIAVLLSTGAPCQELATAIAYTMKVLAQVDDATLLAARGGRR